ncbi:MAG: serine/threonine protein kinase [Acidobacteriota bacterium]|nr:serine/threonine protein kinase [Acidobacteriota bacterium]
MTRLPGTGADEPRTSASPPPSVPAVPPMSPMPLSDSGHHGRFLPGMMVADRYRIIGLLGRGGMGEVYRADDLKLGQQVALKFLPSKVTADTAAVQSLFDEVRMARQVSHANVCRVFDVGETEGHHYVSMEYVDGEDLASLLRRIGRLPEAKAIEIGRQLCAALAAAHNEGVLHRDLKPANIMLDGHGRVKLTDFGLSAVAEVRAGTPIYMAPEQLAGEEVSIRSDLYSLGLVLHELFTGARVFEADNFEELSRQHESSTTASRTKTSGLDVAVDRVIHRCLEKDPAKRPTSALAVAAGLPGADPLAAALAAGETPSPEMVAEAGGEGSLSIKIALPLLIFALACAITVGILQAGRGLVGWVPFDQSPAVLEAKALEIVAELGYATDPSDTASAFATDLSHIEWLDEENAAEERWDVITKGRTPSVHFWWRSSPSVLAPDRTGGISPSPSVSLSNPPRTKPGMISLRLDTEGRLLWLDAVPDELTEGPAAATGGPQPSEAVDVAESPALKGEEQGGPAVGWSRLFELMDLKMEAFKRVEPRATPDHFADERVAWEGDYPDDSGTSLRIEVASLGGRPVSLRMFTPFEPLEPPTTAASSSSSGGRLAGVATVVILLGILLMFMTVIFGGLYVAQRNLRSGRGDSRGARRLGFGVAIALALMWLLSEHTASAADINFFMQMLVFVTALGALTWALYLAVEPFMRRHSSQALIGWTRFIDGRLADPMVGRDILLGCAAGATGRLLAVAPLALGERQETIANYIGLPPTSLAELFGSTLANAAVYVILGLGMSFLYGLSFIALGRRPWAAYLVWLFFLGSMGFLPGITVNGAHPAATLLTSIFWVLGWALWLFVLFRLGILVFVAMATTSRILQETLPSFDFSAWYAWSMTAGLLLFFALAAFAFYRSVEWKGGLAEVLAGD